MNHEIKIKTTLKPFPVPDHIEHEIGILPKGVSVPPRVAITDLSALQLSELCDQFRKDVFLKAGLPAGGYVEMQG